LGLFAAADPTTSGSRDFTARELLDSGAARLSRELSDQPGRRAAMLEVLAQSYAGLGRFEQAQTAITEAVSLRRAEPPIRTTELATALEREARIFMARGMADSAGKASLEALSLRRASESTPAVMAVSIGVVSDYFHMTAKMDSAEWYLREAIAMLGRVDDKAANADMLTNLAVVLSRVSRFTEAGRCRRRCWRFAARICRQHTRGSHPTSAIAR
jgi:eukaryotic-like serine/threonine-protein kinase